VRHSIYLIAFRQSRVPAVDLVSDPPTQLSMPSRGAEPSSESTASLMLVLLHGTVFHTISIKSVTLVFSSAASKLNYFVEHTSLVLVSAPGRSVNSAIEMTVLLLLLICPLCQEEEETALDLLGRCSALSTTRSTLLGFYRMDYTDLDNIHWSLLVKLAKASR